MAGGGAGLVAVVVGGAVTVADSGASTVTVAPNSLAAIDPATDRVVGAVAVGDRPGASSRAPALPVAPGDAKGRARRLSPATRCRREHWVEGAEGGRGDRTA